MSRMSDTTAEAVGPAPAGGRPVAVGPFLLAGATQQDGDVLVSNNPASGLSWEEVKRRVRERHGR